jgi:hypothetical protein
MSVSEHFKLGGDVFHGSGSAGLRRRVLRRCRQRLKPLAPIAATLMDAQQQQR